MSARKSSTREIVRHPEFIFKKIETRRSFGKHRLEYYREPYTDPYPFMMSEFIAAHLVFAYSANALKQSAWRQLRKSALNLDVEHIAKVIRHYMPTIWANMEDQYRQDVLEKVVWIFADYGEVDVTMHLSGSGEARFLVGMSGWVPRATEEKPAIPPIEVLTKPRKAPPEVESKHRPIPDWSLLDVS